ncbi:antA/AntB antirepressor family protein [Pararhizobium qamdonense]|uniref:antA/AntB antirepressor family protein n=1 Tax=Pararhizobium qamdonense TaxID=3031126 RepID=UPI0023E09101|nr:antA/AntB antirepressor family protein [Pararhizobium qamdonense]
MNAHHQFPAISDRSIHGQAVKTVDGREVHRFLGARKDYSNWIKDRIRKYGFVEGVDFIKLEDLSSPNLANAKSRSQATVEYFLTIGMGKEIGMVDRSEKGRAIRKYFLSIEEAAVAPHRVLTMAEIALQNAQALVDFERRQSEQQVAIDAIGMRVSLVEQTASLTAKPQHTETKSEVKTRIGKQYGLPAWVIDRVLTTSPYRPPVFAMVKNGHENAQGSSFAVYQIVEVTKLFKRFVSECKLATPTTATHPDFDVRFKLVQRE